MHPFQQWRNALIALADHRHEIDAQLAQLSPDEQAVLRTGNMKQIEAAAQVAPGGILAALLAFLQGIISNPAILQLILSLLGGLIPQPTPPVPHP